MRNACKNFIKVSWKCLLGRCMRGWGNNIWKDIKEIIYERVRWFRIYYHGNKHPSPQEKQEICWRTERPATPRDKLFHEILHELVKISLWIIRKRAWLILQSWTWGRYVPPKRLWSFNEIHGFISKKQEIVKISKVVRNIYAKKEIKTRP